MVRCSVRNDTTFHCWIFFQNFLICAFETFPFSGYAGHNIAMDLHMEHLNGYLKEAFRRLRGNLNVKTADKVAKSMKSVRKLINNTKERL